MLGLLLLAPAMSMALAENVNPFNIPPTYSSNGTYGPPLESVHDFYSNWPTGVAVSKTGRIFCNFPVIDFTHNFTVGELTAPTTEVPFPNADMNNPGGWYNETLGTQWAVGYLDKLISVQSVVIDPADRLWALDTGRPTLNGNQLYASGYGPKLVGFDLTTNTTFQTIPIPPNVAYPETLLNDVRFDLRPNITESGKGIAYITDSSSEGRNGIIVVDLGTGESWRHLERDPSVLPDPQFVSAYNGIPFNLQIPLGALTGAGQHGRFTVGADGNGLSADGDYLYYMPLSSRRFYRVPTSYLRVHPGPLYPNAAMQAVFAVEYLGQHASHADGLETSSDGTIYVGACEMNAIFSFDPTTQLLSPFVTDPRIQWPDTMSISFDGYLYFTSNQWWRIPPVNNGTDYRVWPIGLYRVPLPNNTTKVTSLQ